MGSAKYYVQVSGGALWRGLGDATGGVGVSEKTHLRQPGFRESLSSRQLRE
jgi:hypothetical protein